MIARPVRRLRIVALDLWRTFFADPVRANVIRARGGGLAGVTTIAVGLLAFAIAALGVIYADRFGAAIVGEGAATLGKASRPGRPVGIPALAYPALAALLLAVVFVGTFGAVYARRLTAVLAVGMMWLPMVLLSGFAWSLRASAWPAWIGLPASLLYPLAVVGLRAWRPAPVIAQAAAALLALATITPAAIGQAIAYTAPGTAGGPALLGASVEQIVTLLGGLVAPVAVLAGAGSVSFGRTVTDFLARSVRRLAGRRLWAMVVVLAVLLTWRLMATVVDIASADSPLRVLVKAVLVAAIIAAATRWWAWATRGFDESPDEVEAGAGVAATPVALLAVAFVFPPMIVLVLAFAEIALLDSQHLVTLGGRLADALGHAWVGASWGALVGTALMAFASWAARRRASVVAAWLGLAGLVMVVTMAWNTAVPGADWGALSTRDYARVAVLIVIAGAIRQAGGWGRTRRLPTATWLTTAFTVMALTALVAQGTFLEDPFRPLLGFTGIGLVFFGVVWGFLTSGAHARATGLPGLGRAAIVLSYAVLTTTLIAWTYATGADAAGGLSGDFATVGKNMLGVTLLLSLLAVWTPALLARPTPAPPEAGSLTRE